MITYLLLIEIKKNEFIKIGKRGNFKFEKGYFVYTGSGKRNGIQRIVRHIKKFKNLQWHIDYLLEKGEIKKIWIIFGDKTNECKMSKMLLYFKGSIPFKKFGSSDCKCPAHLFHFNKNPLKRMEKLIDQIIYLKQ